MKKTQAKKRVYIVYHQHTKDGVRFGQRHALVEGHKKPSTARAHKLTIDATTRLEAARVRKGKVL